MSDIKQKIKEYANIFNQNIDQFLILPEEIERKTLEAMRYSLTNGGKRLRPFLVFEVAKMFGVNFDNSIRVSMAIEMLHTYSLIHDDLPAMDNDSLRRGFPTCHIQFDEATAILAGDGLLTYAFEVLSNEKTHSDANIRCKLINMLANAAGAFDGMIAGQTLDIFAESCEKKFKTEKLVKDIERMKTGRLIRFACEAGAVIGNASKEEILAISSYALKIGQAFQIADDVLDIIGDEKKVGKSLKSDENKVTFVNLYGIEKAREIANTLVEEAKKSLDIFGEKANNLKSLANYFIERDY